MDNAGFWQRIDLTGPCWLWTGATSAAGYGVLRWNGRIVLAHRLGWLLIHGEPIPDGAHLDHLCEVRNCILHTEPVTIAENSRRSRERGRYGNGNTAKVSCGRPGHPSTYDERTSKGERQCSACRRERLRAWRARQSSTTCSSSTHLQEMVSPGSADGSPG